MKGFGRRSILFLMTYAMLLFSFCGCFVFDIQDVVLSDDMVTREYSFSDSSHDTWKIQVERFEISRAENAVIRVIPSDQTRVVAKYPSNLDQYGFSITGKNGVIRIATGASKRYSLKELDITVYANFDEIELSGGGYNLDVDASGMEKLEMEIVGAGNIAVKNLSVRTFELDISGASNVVAVGEANRVEMDVSGAASIDAKQLYCAKAQLSISGAGTASISVTDSLGADLSGVGTISYYGSPTVSSKISGLGKVEQCSQTVYTK